jgi:hypothetical protein
MTLFQAMASESELRRAGEREVEEEEEEEEAEEEAEDEEEDDEDEEEEDDDEDYYEEEDYYTAGTFDEPDDVSYITFEERIQMLGEPRSGPSRTIPYAMAINSLLDPIDGIPVIGTEEMDAPLRRRRRDYFLEHIHRLTSSSSGVTAPTRTTRRERIRANIRRMVRPRQNPEGDRPASQGQVARKAFDKMHKGRKTNAGSITHLATDSGDTLCLICLETPRDTATVPCGHIVACADCSEDLKQCAICREVVECKVEVWFATDPTELNPKCPVCKGLADGLFSPCGHVCYCSECGEHSLECPICNTPVRKLVKVFWS